MPSAKRSLMWSRVGALRPGGFIVVPDGCRRTPATRAGLRQAGRASPLPSARHRSEAPIRSTGCADCGNHSPNRKRIRLAATSSPLARPLQPGSPAHAPGRARERAKVRERAVQQNVTRSFARTAGRWKPVNQAVEELRISFDISAAFYWGSVVQKGPKSTSGHLGF